MNCGIDSKTFVQQCGHISQKKTMNVFKHLNMSDRKVFSLMLLNMVEDEAIGITDGQDCITPNVMVHTAYIVKWDQNQSA
jgi:hypothetical protein